MRLSWAKLLKRVFDLDLKHCLNCGGALKNIAAILKQPVIEKILTHLCSAPVVQCPGCRGRRKERLKSLFSVLRVETCSKVSPGRIRHSIALLPDKSTNLRFLHLLEEHKLAAQILETVNALLSCKALLLRVGTVVDATLIAAPSSTKNRTRLIRQAGSQTGGIQHLLTLKAIRETAARCLAKAQYRSTFRARACSADRRQYPLQDAGA